ncbi:MAG: peptide chain release factor 1 [Candidatus Zixiibacteriota bacterium]
MLEYVEEFEKRLEDINNQLMSPEVLSDQKKIKELSRKRRQVEEVLKTGHKYRSCVMAIKEARQIIAESKDTDLVEMAREELEENSDMLPELEEKFGLLLAPRDPNDEKNAMVEIRAGTGGDEAAIFAGDLYRMYSKFADQNGWKIEVLSTNAIELGGIKEVIFSINGDGAYGKMKYESGVHRVQRVPLTESSGRIHTSAATVAVLLEAEEVDLQIAENELKIDVYRSSGPGGQSVNTTDSAVRITHLPTNTVVTCQDEKSQHKNKAKALQVLRTRLLDKMQEEHNKAIADERRTMVSTGDRSAKIRTYNYPQSRVTDHRIKLTVHNLHEVLDGELDELITALAKHDHEVNLKAVNI